MKSQYQSSKKSIAISSSNSSKKLTKYSSTTSKISSSSKDEEKKNPTSIKTVPNTTSSKRILNRSTIQKLDAGPSISRTRDISNAKTVPKPRQAVEKQTQLLKNKQTPTKSKITASAKPTIAKQNLVMNTVHNVTVSSPPLKRKETPIETSTKQEKTRIRSKSRTLSPEEIVILKTKKANVGTTLNVSAAALAELPSKVREPVAFEVVFDETEKQVREDKLRISKSQVNLDKEDDYDDDFESYESDFETSSSSEVISESSRSSKSTTGNNRESPSNAENEEDLEYKSEVEEESELTHIPITVIHREKEFERKLDSGNYDMNSKKCAGKESFESFDTLANSEQLDSGISYENNVSATLFDAESVTYGGFSQFFITPKITKRGNEIMSKIQFDTIYFTLLDLKPFPYDIYMKMFGNSYTMQSATQTLNNCMESECQTDEDELRSVWTQHPPELDIVSDKALFRICQCSGELLNDVKNDTLPNDDVFENTFQDISKLRQKTSSSGMEGLHDKPINFDRLNIFLSSSSSIISRILSRNTQNLTLNYTDLPNASKGFLRLNTNLLDALQIVHVFANPKFNLILTVHESIENVYRTEFSNLIMVWNCEDPAKPLRLLSTWSEVIRAEICNDSSDIIVCGLRDGSVAMWDMRETYSFCSKLDGHLTHFTATHSVVPSWGGAFDSGAVVDIKSFRSTLKTFSTGKKLKTVQFSSLNETGLLAIWTLVETSAQNFEVPSPTNSKFEYSSPWARVKLIQSAICDLREFIEIKKNHPKTTFEHRKSNFQKDIFNDDVLKELAESQIVGQLGIQGLRFMNLDCGKEIIFVGTNRNFIISCSKTLNKERFRRINIVGSGFLFPTAIKLLPNEDFLAVGLSNGSVMILNCNQDKSYKNHFGRTTENTFRAGASQTKLENFDEIGKSCAIQNIIRNERLSSVSRFDEGEFRPSTTDFISATLEEGKKPYELRIFDEHVLLSGSVLRKDLVQNLEISTDGWLLFALCDGNVRIYDFYMEKEVSFYGNEVVKRNFIALTVSRHENEKNIVLLDSSNNVEIHLLK
ncbi:uncharacterized protein LOC129951963 [Eupeodes corollae]|uniref:uncharacterized protein LOC129951963 n=1 Tax=Eupeodes corollae TaxID=290404 RepID=UPI0024927569|nr:uncharacterized protein LOC129951963 [Eupeodes corollae]